MLSMSLAHIPSVVLHNLNIYFGYIVKNMLSEAYWLRDYLYHHQSAFFGKLYVSQSHVAFRRTEIQGFFHGHRNQDFSVGGYCP